jgi:threonine synthase
MNIADEKSIIIGVQARECAPLWAAFTKGKEAERLVVENQTLAEGVRVSSPVRAEGVLRAVLASQGAICVVGENEIIPCRTALAKLGLYVEPTSAIVLSALEQTIRNIPDPVVVILTGSGYKYDLN